MSEKEKTNKKWTSSGEYKTSYDRIFNREEEEIVFCVDSEEQEFFMTCPRCGYSCHGDICPSCDLLEGD